MALFGPKRIFCPQGVWTTVFDHAFVQMPAGCTIRFLTADGWPPKGIYEEKKSSWIFPGTPLRGPLLPQMTFERGWWNTFYRLSVLPERDTHAEID